jgi:RimJ/RimL family protein N-acetyltransferase
MSHPLASEDQASATGNFWQGALVRLRAIEPEDAETFHQWNADSEMARQVDFVWPPTSLVATRAWAQRMATQEFKGDILCCAIETLAGELVGSINSHSTNHRTGTFGYGVAIGAEHRGRGYAAEAVTLLLRYFFEELRYQKATVIVYADNVASIALHEKLGFQLEGRVRRMVYTRGEYFDQLFYGMTCEEFATRFGQ